MKNKSLNIRGIIYNITKNNLQKEQFVDMNVEGEMGREFKDSQ